MTMKTGQILMELSAK